MIYTHVNPEWRSPSHATPDQHGGQAETVVVCCISLTISDVRWMIG